MGDGQSSFPCGYIDDGEVHVECYDWILELRFSLVSLMITLLSLAGSRGKHDDEHQRYDTSTYYDHLSPTHLQRVEACMMDLVEDE